MRALWILLLAGLLGGCATKSIGTISNGECQIVHVPTFAVAGRTQYDQNWIDDTTEAIVRGCNQPRPQARPADLDAQPAPKSFVRPPKKKLWQRVLPSKKQSIPLPPPAPPAARPVEVAPTPPPPQPQPPPPPSKSPWWWPFNR